MAITGSQPSYMYALGGYARGGATRGGDTDPQTYITIAGVHVGAVPAVAAQHVVDGTLSIAETEGETPNTASFQVMGFQPIDGQEVIMTQGSKNNLDRLFAGTILTDIHAYVGTPANYNEGIHVIDYTWLLTRDTFSQRWQTTSATVIAQDIIAKAAGRGIMSTSVAAGLPVVDEFTVTNQTPAQALSALAARIGGYWKTLYRSRVAGARADVRFGIITDTGQTDPTTLTVASAALTRMENFSVTRDLSQVITRQPVEGGGSTAAADVAVGDTQIPVAELFWYNGGGGTVVSGPQRLTYTGKTQAAPTTAPTVGAVQGSGLTDAAVLVYAYTFVTGAGETLPSVLGHSTPGAGTTTFTLPTPTDAPTNIRDTTGHVADLTPGSTYAYAITYQRDSGETLIGPSISRVAVANPFLPSSCNAILFDVPFRNDGVTTVINMYRKKDAGAFVRIGTVGALYGGTIEDDTPDSHTGVAPPGVSTAIFDQVAISAVAVGPTGTTARKIYRTTNAGSQLKLQQTIANNTSTVGVTDTTADGSLGANAPTSDTSGLVLNAVSTTSGATSSGATSLVLVSAAAFQTGGGWCTVAGLPVRYTGISGNTLTGIPATGSGSITAAIPSGATVTSLSSLIGIAASGVGSILYPIKQGDQVNLRVVIDDTGAQATIATMMLPTVDDGIIEGSVIQDGRISETEARARGTAQLALRSPIDVAITYDTRDKNTHASRTAGVNLPSPTSVVGSFKLQSVTIDTFTPAQWPIAHAHGASKRKTLEDLLREARNA